MTDLFEMMTHLYVSWRIMGWLWLVGSIEVQVSFAKEPYKRDNILQKRRIIWSILLTVATPYHMFHDDLDVCATTNSHVSWLITRRICHVTFWVIWHILCHKRPIGCLESHVIFRKRATDYRALLRKMTCTNKASYDSTYVTFCVTTH